MFDVSVNPPGVRDLYLASLNQCFKGWGGEEQFRWAFERAVGGPPADLILLREDGALLSGTAVTYRRLRFASGHELLAGTMTASWTLPEARGRGCFTRVLAEAIALTAARGAGVLLSFVTEDNGSYRRMRDAGSALYPTRYVFAREASAPARPASTIRVEVEEPSDAVLDRMLRMREASSRDRTRVVYDLAGWRSQMIGRDGKTAVLRLADLGWAITETKGGSLRVQALVLEAGAPVEAALAALLARAIDEGLRFFTCTMEPDVAEACAKLGLTTAPGYFTALPVAPDALRAAGLEGAAGGVFYLSKPFFQSGDRM